MESDQNLEQSLRNLAEALGPTETPEVIRDIVERTRALECEIHPSLSFLNEYLHPLLYVASVISELPSESIWRKVKKTPDLEIFFRQSRWTYKRIGQTFLTNTLISDSRDKLNHAIDLSYEESEFFKLFREQEDILGESSFIASERKFSKKSGKSDLGLIHRVSEKYCIEWNIINYIFPTLTNTETDSFDSFNKPASLFLQILKKEAEYPILQRGQSYFEFKPTEENNSWDRLKRAYKKNMPENQFNRLLRDLNFKKDIYRDTILLAAIELSKNDERLSKKLTHLDRAIEELADEVAKDLKRRGSRGHKYSQEVWQNGERYKFDNNQLIRAPYPQEPDEIVITNLQDGSIITLKRYYS